MVSKASEDLPEPESPVNTTSLSRGISTSMFFRLCSRAPRMVIERKELADCWRRAFKLSSMSAFLGGPLRRGRDLPSEHRKNGNRFPVPRENHQRIVGTWQDAAAARSLAGRKKSRRNRRPFSRSGAVGVDQYFATTGPPKV